MKEGKERGEGREEGREGEKERYRFLVEDHIGALRLFRSAEVRLEVLKANHSRRLLRATYVREDLDERKKEGVRNSEKEAW